MKKVIYYESELSDDFSGFKRKEVPIDQSYSYQRSLLWRGVAYILYSLVRVFAFIYMKLVFHLKIVNRDALKKHKKEGYFIYANHTHAPADGFTPSIIAFPKHVHILVTSENISLKGTKNIMAMLGATPIPNRMSGMRNFKEYIHKLLEKKRVIMIYPEAHIWPYYTRIRSFEAVSFTYPVIENKPIFTFTVTYQKGIFMPRMTCYVDGPFYPRKDCDRRIAIKDLRDKAFNTMVNRSKNSSYEKIKYMKRESELK